jgi:hypothetical protein
VGVAGIRTATPFSRLGASRQIEHRTQVTHHNKDLKPWRRWLQSARKLETLEEFVKLH